MKMKKKRILVTGGAGFIGSNLVEKLLVHDNVLHVTVLDNLETGNIKNIEDFLELPNFTFIEGDIRDISTCIEACTNIDLISHQAALGSVPRSIEDPLLSNHVNVSGTLNVYQAAVKNNIERVVFAASSSTYGDSEELPKIEDIIGKPLSPYAVTKYVNELYADVFATCYKFKYIGLRYFNVFGPKQDPNGPYAAVIPIFMDRAIKNEDSYINGDGEYSRDFTFVDNAVQANILALFNDSSEADNQIYNVAFGERTTLNQLWAYISTVSNTTGRVQHREFREGDIPHSLADISKAKLMLGYSPIVDVQDGIEKVYKWYYDQEHK